MRTALKIKFLSLGILLLLVVFIGVIKGSVNLSFSELFLEENRPILLLRLARIFLAILAGMGLSVCGVALQAILRNPLAEPYLLGTSSGAGLGAVLAIILRVSNLYLPLAAFCGAILTVVLVYHLAKQGNKVSAQSLILSGVIVSVAISAIMVFLISMSGNEALHGVMWWLWGSLEVYDLRLLLVNAAIVIAGVLVVFVFSQDLNAISIGEEEATHLGIDTEAVKKILLVVTSLITASLVSICGIVGFVGLVIPHMTRLIVGPNHRILLPSACISAAIFMVFCDLLSRVVFAPLEIPIGIITALIGTPVFIILLQTRQKVK